MHQEDLLNQISQRGIACITALSLIWSQIAPAYATMQGINDEVSKASVRQVVPATQALGPQFHEDLAEGQGISLEGFSDEVMAHIISYGIDPHVFKQVSRRSYRQALMGAALQGEPQAQYKYGLLLLSSNPSNGEEARAWIKKAAIQGYVSAIKWLKDSPSSNHSLLLMQGKSEVLNVPSFHILHRISLLTEVQEDQKELTTKLKSSLNAEPDNFPSLIRELRLLINQAPAHMKTLLQHDRFPNLTENTLSLWPSDLLREKCDIKAHRILESHEGFVRLNDVIETLEKIYQKPALEESELASKLVELKQQYEDFRSNVCDLSSDRDSIKKYLSPIVLEDVSCDQSFIISKKFATKFLSIDAYGNIISNGTGINAVSSVEEIYAKQNCYLPSVRQELNSALERFKAAIKKSSESFNISRIIQETHPNLLKDPLSYAPLTLLDTQYLTSTSFLKDEDKTFVKLDIFLQTLEELSAGLLLGEDSLGQAEKESLRQLKEAASGLELNYKSYRDELDASTPYKRTLLLSDIKENTLFPGLEWAISSFHRLLFGEGIVPSSLVVVSRVPVKGTSSKVDEETKLINQLKDPRISPVEQKHIRNRLAEDDGFKNLRTYVVQITPEVKGETLNEFLIKARNDPCLFDTLDKEQVQELILSSFLTNPNDAKGDNFIVTEPNAKGKRQIIGIDNDRAFASFIVNHQNYHAIETRNLLFALPQLMGNSLEEPVRKRFLFHTPAQFLLKWLGALQHRNQKYEALIERKILEEKDASLLGLPLKLKTGTVKHILAKMIKLQQLIDENPFTKLQELLKALHPLVGAYYECIAKRPEGILGFFGKLYNKAFNRETSLEAVLPKDPLVVDDEVEEALKQEKTIADDYRIRTQTINEAVEEVLEAFDPTSLPSILKAVLEELHISFPHILEHMLLKIPLSRLLPASSSSIFLDIVFKNFPERLYENEDSFNPLHYAMDTNDLKLFTYLIDKVSIHLTSIEGSDQSQDDPLKEEEHSSALSSLLNLLNQKDSTGKTYLDRAVQKESTGFFTRLVSCGAQEILDIPAVEAFYLKHNPNPNLKESFQTLFTKNPCFQGIVLRNHFFTTTAPCKGATRIYLSGYKKPFYLPEELEDQLFDKSSGKFKAINTDGRREIGLLEKGEYSLFFKKYPAFPGIEQGVRHLAYRLFQSNMGYSALAKINDEPYLLSLGIGKDPKVKTSLAPLERLNPYKEANLSYILEHKPDRLKKIDALSLSQAIVLTLLLQPTNGEPSNYIIEPSPRNPQQSHIISIANDQIFASETTYMQRQENNRLNSILFCFDQMEGKIDKAVCKRILELDPIHFISAWLYNLQAVHDYQKALFIHEKDYLASRNCYLGVLFQEYEVPQILQRLHIMKLIIKDMKGSDSLLSYQDLFMQMSPFMAYHYGKEGKAQAYSSLSILDRYCFIEGYSSSTRETQTLEKNFTSIPLNHKSRIQAIVKGRVYEPIRVLEKIRLLNSNDALINLSSLIQQKIYNNRSIYSILKSGTKLSKIELDLQGYSLDQHTQIFERIGRLPLEKIYLRNSSEIFSSNSPFQKLKFLDIRGCQQIYERFLPLLSRNAPNLIYLHIAGTPSLQSIGESALFDWKILKDWGWISDKTLRFPSLKYLIIHDCKQLTQLSLESPILKMFNVEQCLNLSQLQLKAPGLKNINFKNILLLDDNKVDALITSELKIFNIDGCPNLSFPELRKTYPYYPFGLFSNILDRLKNDIIGLLKGIARELNLKNAGIGDAGAEALSKALEKNTSLTKLDLEGNSIGDKGTIELSKALIINQTLVDLNLAGNKIRDIGAQSLLNALNTNSSLININISGNNITDTCVKEINKLFTENEFLDSLKSRLILKIALCGHYGKERHKLREYLSNGNIPASKYGRDKRLIQMTFNTMRFKYKGHMINIILWEVPEKRFWCLLPDHNNILRDPDAIIYDYSRESESCGGLSFIEDFIEDEDYYLGKYDNYSFRRKKLHLPRFILLESNMALKDPDKFESLIQKADIKNVIKYSVDRDEHDKILNIIVKECIRALLQKA